MKGIAGTPGGNIMFRVTTRSAVSWRDLVRGSLLGIVLTGANGGFGCVSAGFVKADESVTLQPGATAELAPFDWTEFRLR